MVDQWVVRLVVMMAYLLVDLKVCSLVVLLVGLKVHVTVDQWVFRLVVWMVLK